MENDVKIYNSGEKRTAQPDVGAILEAVGQQRANGNIDKARKLGKRLATLTPTFDSDSLSLNLADILKPRFLAPDILYQIKVLLVFTAEAALQMSLPSDLLATTAINAVYDNLRKTSPDFYRNISDGAAFTFYYLAVKRGGDIEKSIGETFAMLCSAGDNEGFIDAGRAVFRHASSVIGNEIEATGFLDV